MITTKSDKTASVTPLMRQYLQIKSRYPDDVLFFRLGDFYEMFYDDAQKAAPVLEVALTKRQNTPMCGVPHHAVTGYIAKLLKAGLSVAVAEQLEDPKKTKGMVKRDVIRVITPGTVVEDELLTSKDNNFLVALSMKKIDQRGSGRWAIAAADVSTGRQWTGGVDYDLTWNQLRAQLASLHPSEILLLGEETQKLFSELAFDAVLRYEPPAADPAASLKSYLERRNPNKLLSLEPAQPLPVEGTDHLFLDESAVRHLELVDGTPSLLSVLDRTRTPLGSRLLRWWILHPSTNLDVIRSRHDQLQEFIDHPLELGDLRDALKEVSDLERITVRAQAGSASPRDMGALRHSLGRLPDLRACLGQMSRPAESDAFRALSSELTAPPGLLDETLSFLSDSLPARISDGGVIRDGVNEELDELRNVRRHGKKWIAQMEAAEKAKTGITNLKVGYNDVFGYFLEVSKSHLPKVPPEWIRRQTLANAERFITPALKEQEEKILGAQGRIDQMEAEIFSDVVKRTAAAAPALFGISRSVARLDVIAALADVAVEKGYRRPRLTDTDELFIRGGRHPVIEQQIGRDRFIPNDLLLGGDGKRLSIITGPNMAGKSTYLRQNALIIIMAQAGSFVPAEEAVIGLVDKIYTRIGASDRLAQGQSTFMVEMTEVAALLQNSTPRSFLVLDEVGRGTSTYDGISIAWAVVDYLSRPPDTDRHSGRSREAAEIRNLESLDPGVRRDDEAPPFTGGSRTLFATHYFELTQLGDMLPSVGNAHATAKEWPGPDGRRQVVFLYQIKPGPADRSYGIHVAEMAGLPEDCIDRAREILKQLEAGSHHISEPGRKKNASAQLEMFEAHPVIDELNQLHVESLTPLEALNKLAELKKKVE